MNARKQETGEILKKDNMRRKTGKDTIKKETTNTRKQESGNEAGM
jgi:hypothetical protein